MRNLQDERRERLKRILSDKTEEEQETILGECCRSLAVNECCARLQTSDTRDSWSIWQLRSYSCLLHHGFPGNLWLYVASNLLLRML